MKTFKLTDELKVRIETQMIYNCKIANTAHPAKIQLEFVPQGKTFDYDDFLIWTQKNENIDLSAEDLTILIYNTINELIQPKKLWVKITTPPSAKNYTLEIEKGEK